MDTPLPTIEFSTLSVPLLTFFGPGARADYDVDAPYQRGSVWSAGQQADLVRSLLIGIPIGGIYRARFLVPGKGQFWRIVDGKQRLLAIWAFADDRLSVPAAWWPARSIDPARVREDGTITYSGLSDYGRRTFGMRTVAVLDFVSDHEVVEVAPGTGTRGSDRQFISRDRTPAEAIAYEAMVYGLINASGTAQTAADLAQAASVAAS